MGWRQAIRSVTKERAISALLAQRAVKPKQLSQQLGIELERAKALLEELVEEGFAQRLGASYAPTYAAFLADAQMPIRERGVWLAIHPSREPRVFAKKPAQPLHGAKVVRLIPLTQISVEAVEEERNVLREVEKKLRKARRVLRSSASPRAKSYAKRLLVLAINDLGEEAQRLGLEEVAEKAWRLKKLLAKKKEIDAKTATRYVKRVRRLGDELRQFVGAAA